MNQRTRCSPNLARLKAFDVYFYNKRIYEKNECNYENLLLRLQKQQAEQQAEFQKRMIEFMKNAS